ncbi:MAG: TenA family transcriptional regulator [Rubrobacteraceae bacterium]
MRTQDLLDRHREAWRAATKHPFLKSVRDGTLLREAFATWLVQDYLFVTDGLSFQSRLISRAPRRDQALLISGLSALETELGWFEERAENRKLGLDAPRHPTTEAYRDFLHGLERESYAAKITALWALERAYLESWRNAAPGHPGYREFVEHWTTPEFAGYVTGLEEAADAALEAADESELERAEAAFVETIRLEKEFWEMALGKDGG